MTSIENRQQIYCGDNLEVLDNLCNSGLEEKVDLIYLDPPFFTKKKQNEIIWEGRKWKNGKIIQKGKGMIKHV